MSELIVLKMYLNKISPCYISIAELPKIINDSVLLQQRFSKEVLIMQYFSKVQIVPQYSEASCVIQLFSKAPLIVAQIIFHKSYRA